MIIFGPVVVKYVWKKRISGKLCQFNEPCYSEHYFALTPHYIKVPLYWWLFLTKSNINMCF